VSLTRTGPEPVLELLTHNLLVSSESCLYGVFSVAWASLAMQDPMEDHPALLLDLSHAGPDIITIVLGSLPLRDRFTCALVCKTWAEAATAATYSIILEQNGMQDLSSLQHWLEKHGNMLEVLQLHECYEGYDAVLTALPCCAKLQYLLLQDVSMASRTWGDIASANKLTSISLTYVQTASQQADVVAALTALPNLEQLIWCDVHCSGNEELTDSLLLQGMTRLTSLQLHRVTAAALQHLGSLTKLQHLSISAAYDWAAAGGPGLQELKALTRLELWTADLVDVPTSASRLTALQQLKLQTATPTALNGLQVLPGLTQLCVPDMIGLSSESPPLQLPGLRHLELHCDDNSIMPMSYLASSTQLQFLRLSGFQLKGPGSLVASTMLQHLELFYCIFDAADGAAVPVSLQQVFPGPPGRPHLTSLELRVRPALQQAAVECLVECCSNLQVLHLLTLQDSCVPALARLPGLTNLGLNWVSDEDYGALAQLTGLRHLAVKDTYNMFAVELRQLAALKQLTKLGFASISSYGNQVYTLGQHFMEDTGPGYPYAIINKVCVDHEGTIRLPCAVWYGCSSAGRHLGLGGGDMG